MATELILAVLHHLLAFSIPAILVAELVWLRTDLTAARLRGLSRLDGFYGMAALGLIVVGVGRVAFGLRGYEFYIGNHVFWTKMAAFLVIGLLSVTPTKRILAWRRAATQSPTFTPPAAEVAAVRRLVHLELVLIPVVLLMAAALGRGIGA